MKKNLLMLVVALLVSLGNFGLYENASAAGDGDVNSSTSYIGIENGNQQKNTRAATARAVKVANQTLSVTNKTQTISWKIAPIPPYRVTGFSGSITITDLWHGSMQRVFVKGLRGSIKSPMLKNLYAATLDGKALPIGRSLGLSRIQWRN
ncbi:hypothetical protein MFLO_05040 [Listeria floridensis FSL S10-1187]|uniref:Uncharacterized protein n=1 Tax=Listeria floridensis FSL S10-1187 TaxID=1265817 RepID=A0ABP3AZF0_9LIST|nr:hypothetical protein [Listeria floridensis]EUJ32955.1 hypothetical protein MFLO_05040 [Listeria floridensis FSL S10-1187]